MKKANRYRSDADTDTVGLTSATKIISFTTNFSVVSQNTYVNKDKVRPSMVRIRMAVAAERLHAVIIISYKRHIITLLSAKLIPMTCFLP